MPKTLAVADGSFAAIQMPLAGEKANAQTNGTGAGLEELTIKPITDRLVDARTRLADAEVNVAAHRTAIMALAYYTPGMASNSRKRFAVPWEHHGYGYSSDGSIQTDMSPGDVAITSLRLVPGVIIRRIGTYVKGLGFTAMPTSLPMVELCRMSTSGYLEVLATATDPSVNTAGLNGYHGVDADDLAIMINSGYEYFIRLRNGGSAGGGTGYSYLWSFWETE